MNETDYVRVALGTCHWWMHPDYLATDPHPKLRTCVNWTPTPSPTPEGCNCGYSSSYVGTCPKHGTPIPGPQPTDEAHTWRQRAEEAEEVVGTLQLHNERLRAALDTIVNGECHSLDAAREIAGIALDLDGEA